MRVELSPDWSSLARIPSKAAGLGSPPARMARRVLAAARAGSSRATAGSVVAAPFARSERVVRSVTRVAAGMSPQRPETGRGAHGRAIGRRTPRCNLALRGRREASGGASGRPLRGLSGACARRSRAPPSPGAVRAPPTVLPAFTKAVLMVCPTRNPNSLSLWYRSELLAALLAAFLVLRYPRAKPVGPLRQKNTNGSVATVRQVPPLARAQIRQRRGGTGVRQTGPGDALRPPKRNKKG